MDLVNRRIPTISDINRVNSFIKGNEVRISSISEGIECLIINGKVTDINGEPFRNKRFQDKFSYFAEKLTKYKYIGRGRVVYFGKAGDDSIKNLTNIHYTASQISEERLAKIRIELEAIVPESQAKIPPRGIFSLLGGITNNINSKESSYSVFLQKEIIVKERESKREKQFVEEESDKGKRILFVDLNSERAIYYNPFVKLSGKIEDVMSDYIKVTHSGKTYRIENTNERQYKAIQEVFYTGKLKTFQFKANINNNKIENAQMI